MTVSSVALSAAAGAGISTLQAWYLRARNAPRELLDTISSLISNWRRRESKQHLVRLWSGVCALVESSGCLVGLVRHQ
jgi:hypothetical protein